MAMAFNQAYIFEIPTIPGAVVYLEVVVVSLRSRLPGELYFMVDVFPSKRK